MNKSVQSKKLVIAFIDLWIASVVIGLVYAITLITFFVIKAGKIFNYIDSANTFDLAHNIAFLAIILLESIVMGGLR